MKVYRYMSEQEFAKITAGVTIQSNNHFNDYATDSCGICFLPEENIFWSEILEQRVHFTPEECFQFLTGIISRNAILVEFEVDTRLTNLTKSFGIYADPFTDSWDYLIKIDELCTNTYDIDTFIPTRYCFGGENKWYNVN